MLNFFCQTPISMVTNKMVIILNKYWEILNQCPSLLEKDIIKILAKLSSVYNLYNTKVIENVGRRWALKNGGRWTLRTGGR